MPDARLETSIQETWNRIAAWLEVNAVEILDDLRPGASEAQLQHAEDQLGVELPESVKNSYRIYNGAEGAGLFSCEDFLSLEEMVSKWKALKEIWDTGFFSEFSGKPEGPVQPDWWNPRWIPWLSDVSGNHLCFDLAPACGGTVGQIIRFWHDESDRVVLASGICEWLSQFADDLHSGQYVFSQEYGVLSLEDARELMDAEGG
jgi:cell wall assembly regulator SMI1